MPLCRSLLVSTLAAVLWPAIPACASDASDASASPAGFSSAAPSPRPEPRALHSPAGLWMEGRGEPAVHEEGSANDPQREAAPAPATPADARYASTLDAASHSASPVVIQPAGRALSLAPGRVPRTGWELHGRAGPLRWMSPLDGEGSTQLRLGGRLPGQPRMPGMGLFNIGVNYNFE